MSLKQFLFTSESVTEGHPDKIADQISDGVLDAVFSQDPYGRVACETLVTTGLAFVAGEITTRCYVDIPKVTREVIRDVGYTRAKYGFDFETCAVVTAIQEQSSDIALGVDIQGAGDQGLMFGYATTRDARADAHADPAGAQAVHAPDRGPAQGDPGLPAARREVAGDHRVHRRQAGPGGHGGDLDAAQPRGDTEADPRGHHRYGHPPDPPQGTR